MRGCKRKASTPWVSCAIIQLLGHCLLLTTHTGCLSPGWTSQPSSLCLLMIPVGGSGLCALSLFAHSGHVLFAQPSQLDICMTVSSINMVIHNLIFLSSFTIIPAQENGKFVASLLSKLSDHSIVHQCTVTV